MEIAVRPWGNFRTYVMNDKCTVKILHVNAGQKLSRQYHKKREELWIILDEGLVVEVGDKVLHPKKLEEIRIPKGAIHRLSGKGGGDVLEISFGSFDEQDIVRLDDEYGRK